MEQELTAGLGEGQIAEFVEDQEVEPAQQIGHAPLPVGSGLGIELVDQIDDIEEPAAGAAAEYPSGEGRGGISRDCRAPWRSSRERFQLRMG